MRKTLFDGFTSYFYFSLQDRKGIILLTAICLFTYMAPLIIRKYAEQGQTQIDFSVEKKLVEQLALQKASEDEEASDLSSDHQSGGLFVFDPNTATKSDFVKLGLSPKTAQTIENYRAKGGKFRKPEDFAKIWSISKTDFDRLLPFINIPGNNPVAIKKDKEVTNKSVALFPFNPNKATEADFENLGLPDKVIQSITNYRSKGGKFKHAADFKKIYTLSAEDYARLEPFIQIETAEGNENFPVMASLHAGVPYAPASNGKSKTIIIDINTADEMEWQKLKGIGPALSKRIATYRNNLGGFYAIEQVSEIYNFPDSTYQAIKPQLKITEPAQLKKVNINKATEAELALHPYIGKKEAKWISAYRLQHGNYRSVEDVLKSFPKGDEVWLNKVKKYLEI